MIDLVLVDTSIWINHLRTGNPKLKTLLNKTKVVCHPFIIGELACGNIKNRKEILSLLETLPASQVVHNEEFHYFLEHNKLMGKGIGFVDVHLLASATLSQIPIWTEDKNLKKVAKHLNLSYV